MRFTFYSIFEISWGIPTGHWNEIIPIKQIYKAKLEFPTVFLKVALKCKIPHTYKLSPSTLLLRFVCINYLIDFVIAEPCYSSIYGTETSTGEVYFVFLVFIL